ncbi:activating signal cointegrator 1 complex subunit 1, partial [Phtheirospermum japonicum]
VIEGNSAESVSKASEKIKIIIDKAYNSRELGYSHFVSLPLAIHPGLVDKLVNFQNKILEIAASDKDGNVECDTDEEEEDQKSTKASGVVVELKAEKDDAHVKVNITSGEHSTKAPLVTELKAKDATKTSYKDSGIEKSIFIKPKAFHLTVLVLKLWNKDRVKAAAEVLQSVSSKVMDALENKTVSIRLKGLDIMKGSLAKAQVLYVPVEEIGDEGRLLRACEVIIAAFVEAGLVTENDVQQKLKLHASVMNARHRRRKKRTKKIDLFDARGVFDLYGSEEWGEYPIREAHLSQRFVYDENGYYHCCASIPFPDEMHVD